MKPWKTLATDGKFTLRQREREYMVLESGKILLTSRQHGEEPELVRVGCARLMTDNPTVFIGGLGFGFILRAALDHLPDVAKVVVNEPSKTVVEWNRGPLAAVNQEALEDPRVSVEVGDVQSVLSRHRQKLDVVLLDLDNGPFAVDVKDDLSLYSVGGLSSVRASLAPGGRLAVLSANTHPGFNKRLVSVGFTASVVTAGQSLVFVGDVR